MSLDKLKKIEELISSKEHKDRLKSISLIKELSVDEVKTLLIKYATFWDKQFKREFSKEALDQFGKEIIESIVNLVKNENLPIKFTINLLSKFDDPFVIDFIATYLSHFRTDIRLESQRIILEYSSEYAVFVQWCNDLKDFKLLQNLLDKIPVENIAKYIDRLNDWDRNAFLGKPATKEYLAHRKLTNLFAVIDDSTEGRLLVRKTESSKIYLESISERLQAPKGLIGWVVRNWDAVDSLYATFTIPKKSGGQRSISSPPDKLKYVQELIYKNVLSKALLHPCCHGFISGRSIITNAEYHTNKDVVVNVDIKDFFPSISASRVYGVFQSLGFNKHEARLLTRIATRNNCLPQGAPTSPIIANITCKRLDSRLSGLVKKMDGKYSRYADDLTFSGDEKILKVIPRIYKIIGAEGFLVAIEKTRVTRKGNRQEVTGLTVNKKISIQRKRRKNLRAIIHHFKTSKSIHWNGKDLSVQSLKGHIAFLKSVHPETASSYNDVIKKSKK